MQWLRILVWGLACGGLLAVGCDDEGDAGGGGTGHGDTDGSPECAVIDPMAAEIECGTFVDTDEGCGGDVETGDSGSDSDGGSDSGSCTDEHDASNAEVVACAAQAAADGEAFAVGFFYSRNGGQFATTTFWHVLDDAQTWRSHSGHEDLCEVSERTLHGAVDLSTVAGCTSWTCIESAMNAAGQVATCEQSTNCDGV